MKIDQTGAYRVAGVCGVGGPLDGVGKGGQLGNVGEGRLDEVASCLDGAQAPVVVVLTRLNSLHQQCYLSTWLEYSCKFSEAFQHVLPLYCELQGHFAMSVLPVGSHSQ